MSLNPLLVVAHDPKRGPRVSDVGQIKIPWNDRDRFMEIHRTRNVGFGDLIKAHNGSHDET